MDCQRCHAEHATYHFTVVEKGSLMEAHLCAKCALETQAMSSPGGAGTTKVSTVPKTSNTLKLKKGEACPCCGFTLQDILKRQRLGCANDYAFFESNLEKIVREVQGSTQHVGKQPGKPTPEKERENMEAERKKQERVQKEKDLARLKAELDEVVKRENYERAAQIRDRIRALEEEIKGP